MLNKIKSPYCFKFIISNFLKEKNCLSIFKYNKNYQKKLGLSIDYYKKYFYQIEIEIIQINPLKEEKNIFVQLKRVSKCFYHIYINDKETEKNYITNNEYNKTPKIKIIIDEGVFSLEGLFKNCKSIQEINFTRFNRDNIYNMYEMFHGCESLNKLNIKKLITNNVEDMGGMFYGCSSLKELDLNNFIFNKVDNTFEMFAFCTSLNKIEMNNFVVNHKMNTRFMFSHCSEELKDTIMKQFKDLEEISFYNYIEE